MWRPVAIVVGLLLCGSVVRGQSALQAELKDTDIASHWIYNDLPRALAQAKTTNKPIFVVLRCVPCPPGRALDGQVMQPGPEMEALEKQFVCVRIPQTRGLDLVLFQYDYDQSWSAMFLTPDKTILGRYGTRAGNGSNSETHISLAGLRKSMERALELYKGYPGNKPALAGKTARSADYPVPEKIPGLEARAVGEVTRKTCIHCHMIRENILRDKWLEGKLTAHDVYVYPLPEAVGMAMDVDDGLVVKSVVAGSPAARAGIGRGDRMVSMASQPLISIADVQWVLQHAMEEARIPVVFMHDGARMEKTLVLAGNWRESDIGWRASSWFGLRHGAKFTPLPEAEKLKRGIAADAMALQVTELFNPNAAPLSKAGLRRNDVIVAVDGKSDLLSESQFLVYLRLKYGPKDAPQLTIVRGGKKLDVTIPMW